MGIGSHDGSRSVGQDDGFIGRDETGCIRVTVGPDRRYADVSISTAWRERVGVDGLADALVHAASEGRKFAAAEVAPRPDVVGQPHDNWAGELFAEFGRLTGRQQDEALFRLAEQLDSVSDELGRSLQRLEELQAASFTGTDDRRRLTAELSATGDLISVTIDGAWLRDARIDPLKTAVQTALFNAQDALVAATSEDGHSSFSERSRRMITEPGGVRRWITEEGITDEQ